MYVLIAGLVIFFAMHLVPAMPGLHNQLKTAFTENGWKGIMSLISIGGFVLIVIGWQRTGFIPVYEPPASGHYVTRIVMLPALILLFAAYIPSSIKCYTRHPMLWGTVLWSAGHLLANGDFRSLLVFGSFGVWAMFDMWSATQRGAVLAARGRGWEWNTLVAVAGLGASMLLARFHAVLFGVPIPSG